MIFFHGMYIRKRKVHSRGKDYTYLELARTVRKNGKVYQERLCSLGSPESSSGLRGVIPLTA